MPGWLHRLRLRLQATFSPRRARDIREELHLHLQLAEEEYLAQGLPLEEARRRARQEFGNPERFQDVSYELFAFTIVEDVARDLKHAAREARRSLGVTAVAMASLSLGIGATTAAFAVLDAFLLRGLPVREPERLVAFSTSASVRWAAWAYAPYERWASDPGRLFEAAAASDPRRYDIPLRGTDATAAVRVSLVSANYLQVLGVDLALGRTLTAADAQEPAASTAVISHAFWQRWFGAADVIGQRLNLSNVSYEIVGVAQPGFTGHVVGHPADVWIPITRHAAMSPAGASPDDDPWGTGPRWLRILARLHDGVDVEAAATSARLIRERFLADKAGALGDGSPAIAREREQALTLPGAAAGYGPERSRYARPMVIVFSITALVLLAACANFTNLMVARSEVRRREFGIRLALGGGYARLVRQAATECLALALLAGALGVLLAHWMSAVALTRFAAMITPVDLALRLDARVFGFAAVCAALVAIAGLWPSAVAVRSSSASSLHQSGVGRSHGRMRGVAGRSTLVFQLAICAVLLVASGLLLRTVTTLRMQDLGFDRNILLVSIAPGDAGYEGEAARILVERLGERLVAVPGILGVGASGTALLDSSHYWIVDSQDLMTDRGRTVPGARWTFTSVAPGFFEAVGMAVRQGRAFDARGAGAEGIVINQSLASLLFGAEDPIGRGLRMGPKAPLQRVLGVVEDATQTAPRGRGMGVIYQPLDSFNRLVLAVRTASASHEAVPTVLHQLGAVAPDLPIGDLRTIAELIDEAIALERLMSGIALILAGLAVAIGCVGLYALMSYEVAQRTRELGIRLALGATRRQVLSLVFRDSARLVAPALAIGIPLGIASSRSLSSHLYGVAPGDPLTLLAVAVLLTMVAAGATLWPARRASRIDPVALLRAE